MNQLKVAFYPEGGSGPVLKYFDELKIRRPDAGTKLALDLKMLEDEGVRSKHVSIRPLGQGLWELKRLFEGVQYRIFFCVGGGYIWLLHAIEKKSAKTPLDDLRLARKRMRRCES
jgi:phage-related protein